MIHWAQVKMRTEDERTKCPECWMPNDAPDDAHQPHWLPEYSYPCRTCGRPWYSTERYPHADRIIRPSQRTPTRIERRDVA